MLEFVFILGGQDGHVGNGPQIGQIEETMMGGPVVSHEAATVQGQDDGKLLQADVVENLVVGALEERRIDGHDRDDPLRCQTGGKGDGVLFGDADVEETGWESPGELVEARTLAHGRRNGHDPGVFLGQAQEGVAEHPGIGDPSTRRRDGFPRLDAEGADAVEEQRFGFGRAVPLAFSGHHVDQNGSGNVPDVLQILDEMVQAVPLQGAHVGKAQVFKQGPGQEEAFQGLLGLPGELQHLLADAWQGPEEALDLGADLHGALARHHPVQ